MSGVLVPRPSWLADRGPAATSPVGSAPNGTTRPGTRSSSHVAHAVRLHHRGCGHNHLLTGGSGPFLVAATCRGARICEPAGAPDAMRPTVTSHGYGHLAQRVLTGRQISQRLPASARSRCLRGLAVGGAADFRTGLSARAARAADMRSRPRRVGDRELPNWACALTLCDRPSIWPERTVPPSGVAACAVALAAGTTPIEGVAPALVTSMPGSAGPVRSRPRPGRHHQSR
jgi:hypothetical protein